MPPNCCGAMPLPPGSTMDPGAGDCVCGTIAATMQRPSGSDIIMPGEGGGTGVCCPGTNGDIHGELAKSAKFWSGVVKPPYCGDWRGSAGQLPGGPEGGNCVPIPCLPPPFAPGGNSPDGICLSPYCGPWRGPGGTSASAPFFCISMLGTARFTSIRLPPRKARKRDVSPQSRRSTAAASENKANPKPRCFWELFSSLCFCSQHFFTPGPNSLKICCTSSSSTPCGMPPMKTLWAF